MKNNRQDLPIFVVQKHKATRLHYDVRLEIDGVLVSWAMHPGPSNNPRYRRLAVHVPDHPLWYAHFEGVIAAGHYGAGPVMVWDTGRYRPMYTKHDQQRTMHNCFEHGFIKVFFFGKKLRGNYTLTRKESYKKHWFLHKEIDRYANTPAHITQSLSRSALTNRTLGQIVHDVQNKPHKQGATFLTGCSTKSTEELYRNKLTRDKRTR